MTRGELVIENKYYCKRGMRRKAGGSFNDAENIMSKMKEISREKKLAQHQLQKK